MNENMEKEDGMVNTEGEENTAGTEGQEEGLENTGSGEGATEPAKEEPAKAEPSKAEPAKDGFLLKTEKGEMQLTAQEAQDYILAGIRASQPQQSDLQKVAQQAGVNPGEVAAILQQAKEQKSLLEKQQAEMRIRQMMAEGTPEEQARQLVNYQMAEEKRQKEAQAARQAEEQDRLQAEWQENAMKKQMQNFSDLLPDVIADRTKDGKRFAFTADEAAEIDKGMDPVAAYYFCQSKALKAQLDGQNKNMSNQKSAVGSAAGAADVSETDAFLAGFDKAFNG